MRVLTEIGEVGIYAENGTYVLRPSLYAMTQLGTPEDIVEVYSGVMNGDLQSALAMIYACAEDDLSEVFGYHEGGGNGLVYVPGAAPVDHILPIGQCLAKHGVTGALNPLPRRADQEPEFTTRFVARDHVALAVAHLGVSESDAWNMTMTSVVAALRAKFPQSEINAPGAKAPTKEEHEATEAWYDRVEAARRAKNRNY